MNFLAVVTPPAAIYHKPIINNKLLSVVSYSKLEKTQQNVNQLSTIQKTDKNQTKITQGIKSIVIMNGE